MVVALEAGGARGLVLDFDYGEVPAATFTATSLPIAVGWLGAPSMLPANVQIGERKAVDQGPRPSS